jgi:phosphoketolase
MELFDADGVPVASIVDWLPRGELRMSANPHTNCGRYPRDLELTDFRDHRVKARETAEATRVWGSWPTTAYAAATTSTSSSPVNNPHPPGWTWTPPPRTAPAASASGPGLQ